MEKTDGRLSKLGVCVQIDDSELSLYQIKATSAYLISTSHLNILKAGLWTSTRNVDNEHF